MNALCDALIFSAFMGDHDVNASNFMVDQDSKSVKRIDFGHAFHSLAKKRMRGVGGGRSQNDVLDWFNRKAVTSIDPGFLSHYLPNCYVDRSIGAPSKLWRDFPGLVFSKEMHGALKRFCKNYKMEFIKKQLDATKDNIKVASGQVKGDKNRKVFFKSLSSIVKELHVGDAPNDIDEVFDILQSFCEQQLRNMIEVEKTYAIQIEIEDR